MNTCCPTCTRPSSTLYCHNCASSIAHTQNTHHDIIDQRARNEQLRIWITGKLESQARRSQLAETVHRYRQRVSAIEQQVLVKRKDLQSKRILLAAKQESLRLRRERIARARALIQQATFAPDSSDDSTPDHDTFHTALLHSLKLTLNQQLDALCKEKQIKVRQLLDLFPIDPSTTVNLDGQRAVFAKQYPGCGFIGNIPFPSNIRDVLFMDPFLVTTALSLITQVIVISARYLDLPLPFRMEFLGSKGSIRRWGAEGKQVVMLTPSDPGFENGIAMLSRNISALCFFQGVPEAMMKPWDLLHNMWQFLHSPSLGETIHKSVLNADKRNGMIADDQIRSVRSRSVHLTDPQTVDQLRKAASLASTSAAAEDLAGALEHPKEDADANGSSAWNIVDKPQPPLPSEPEDIEHWVQSGAF